MGDKETSVTLLAGDVKFKGSKVAFKMFNVAFIFLVIELEKAVMSIKYESGTTEFKLPTVIVTVPSELIVVGLKLTDEPKGSPEVEKLTVSEKLFKKIYRNIISN